ncbi:hypothetical protein ACOSQ4_011072 [Xanthoceras sorbifolium]
MSVFSLEWKCIFDHKTTTSYHRLPVCLNFGVVKPLALVYCTLHSLNPKSQTSVQPSPEFQGGGFRYDS